jgi:eukaryotic-like serine/threonine-protein kinase
VLRPVLSPVYYVASGHIVFAQEGTLLGQRFDASAGAVQGEPFPIVEPVRGFASSGWAGFSVSQSGVLVYTSSLDRSRMAWIDRSGRELAGVGVPGDVHRVRLSPDGTKALFDRAEPRTGTLDLWTVDLARNTETRVTSSPGSEISGAWLPDQRGVVFSASRGGPPHLYRLDLATGSEEELTPAGRLQFTEAVSPDGKTLLYNERSERGDMDVLALPLAGPRTPSPVLASVFAERASAFSPDGRFLAFVSNESGAAEVYVRPFPGQGASTRVSTGGGEAPCWSRGSHELFYIGRNGEVTATPVRTTPTLELGRPATLFTLKKSGGARSDLWGWASYDVAKDGSKFLAILPETVAIEQPLSVIVNWPAEAQSRAGP